MGSVHTESKNKKFPPQYILKHELLGRMISYSLTPRNKEKYIPLAKTDENFARILNEEKCHKSPIIGIYTSYYFNSDIYIYNCNICEFIGSKNFSGFTTHYFHTMFDHLQLQHGTTKLQKPSHRLHELDEFNEWYWGLVNSRNCLQPPVNGSQLKYMVEKYGLTEYSYFISYIILPRCDFFCVLCGKEYAVPPAREVILSHLKKNCVILHDVMKAWKSGVY